jgi:hypothetical protein
MRTRTKVVLWLLALGVVAMLVVFSEEPSFPKRTYPDTCTPKGIDPAQMKEGACQQDGTTTVVANIGDTLKIETLAARLEGIRDTASLSGPGGTEAAQGRFLIFDLAITNRNPNSALLGKDQIVLLAGGERLGEDIEAERHYEPHSFLTHRHPIRPGETVHGTVVFQVSAGEAKGIGELGNLDIANFGVRGDAFDVKTVLDVPEIGVMRTYGPK